MLLVISEVDLSDRARIDDRRERKGFSTPENTLITSFHTASASSGHSPPSFNSGLHRNVEVDKCSRLLRIETAVIELKVGTVGDL